MNKELIGRLRTQSIVEYTAIKRETKNKYYNPQQVAGNRELFELIDQDIYLNNRRKRLKGEQVVEIMNYMCFHSMNTMERINNHI